MSYSYIYKHVVSGCDNRTYDDYSAILGGFCNTVTGACSAILGGACNTVSAAYNYAGVFGCNVSAVMGKAFHANNFVAQNIPNGAGTLPPGALYYLIVGGVKQVHVV